MIRPGGTKVDVEESQHGSGGKGVGAVPGNREAESS